MIMKATSGLCPGLAVQQITGLIKEKETDLNIHINNLSNLLI